MARNTARQIKRAFVLRFLSIALLTGSASVASAQWEVSGDLYTGLTYTDNVGLQPNSGKRDEIIWELGPTIIATRDGKSVDIDFQYRLQGLLYEDDDERNEVYNYLQTQLRAEVVPDWIRFDADASISQTVIDPRVANTNSSISTSGNSAETITVNASPTLYRQLGPSTLFQLGATAGLIEYDDPMLVDNTQLDYFATIANDGRGGTFSWSFGYTQKEVDYDIGREIELARATGEIGLRLGPRSEFVVSGGEDINDFGNIPGSGVSEGSFWNVGFRGGIGSTIQYDIRVGEQFFGDSYSVQFTRDSRAIETSLTYSEDATTVGAQQLDFSNGLSLLGLAGNFANQLDVNGFELPTRDPELYIRRRLDFSNTLTMRRSTLLAGVYYEDRTFIRTELEGARENVQGFRAEWSWDFDRSTVVQLRTNYQRLDSRDGVSQPKDFRIDLTMRKDVFARSYIQGTIWRNTRDAPQDQLNYEEHAIQIGFGRRF